MAAQKRLYHNPSLATQVTGWKYVGENVGYGPDVSTLFQAFMNSTPHRDNILDHDFTQIGVGAVTVSGTTWVSMVFREPLHATSSTTKKSAPKPKPKATTSRATVSHAATAGRAPAKRALPPVPAPPAASAAAAARSPAFACLATPAVAERVKDVTDLDRSARLVESAQLLVRGYQCGRGLPMTGVLDDPTLRALAQV